MSDRQHADYDHGTIEKKWQRYWLENKTFKTEDFLDKPKYYVLDMFPYPSGNGLHVGHPEGYTATDIVARYKRMRGFNVLHPMGWDAFGLPAEQHAVKTKTHPRMTTNENITTFRRQIQSLGLSYDWDREIDTTSADYYKWTQWIFMKLFEKGLAYESYAPVNWCEELGTVLANEEVIDGKSEVGDYPVIKKPMRQWVLKITAYAERLLADLDELDWPDAIKEQQRNWIGKSVGAEITFDIADHSAKRVTVFTTRPDTLFGATFFVLAPEHPLVAEITTKAQSEAVSAYVERTRQRSDRDRIATTEKSGVFTGAYAVNPVNSAKMPIYIADYVLISYGHGAIMAVPGHDARDHEFARKFGLPIKQVLTGGQKPIEEEAFEGEGTLVNSGFLDNLVKKNAIAKMCIWLEEKHIGKGAITYKLKDWLFSRQRYWGEPFPLLRGEDGSIRLVDEAQLPVVLPEVDDYRPTHTGESPLAKATQWSEVMLDGKRYTRETNTMPQWAGSCWYYLRYIDPRNKEAAFDQKKENYWLPVDLYVGGAEHAVLHLLYARFWHKVLYDLGLVSSREPFKRLVNQGMILGENGEKMSKSRGNVINPDEIVEGWGADSFRLYEMFMGPLEATKPWQTNGIVGVNRFLRRVWRLFIADEGSLAKVITDKQDSENFAKTVHKTIKKVTEDTDNMRFNTAIAAMMELVNTAYKEESIHRGTAESLVLLLAPYAPHIAEELWERFGHKPTLAYHAWPDYNPALCVEDMVTVSVQVGGKFRGTVDVEKTADQQQVAASAMKVEQIARHVTGKTIVKEIFVPGKIINFIVK